MRGLFGVLQLANFAAMDCRACLFLCFFLPRMRGLFGVLQLANFAAMDCRACLFLCFFARMRVLFGVLQLVNFAAMDCRACLFVYCFSANARSFRGVAAMDCLHFIIWQECQLQHLMNFFGRYTHSTLT